MGEKLFALDIGTRSVVGIVLEQRDQTFHVLDLIAEEHKERAMMDGQIHNVLAVAEVIQSVKSKLEAKFGPLKKVSVAAAGRALKTIQAKVEIDIQNRPLFSEEDVSRLELEAVQKAQEMLVTDQDPTRKFHYYCVGYSVLYYRLDGEEIGSLVDQQGTTASVEVIATFLPRVVVESLLAALSRANLEMEALTLEPIAAINVLIPTSMRRLNVALVDIGAGTSDIALTDKGTVIAYGMVPHAGDEITEAISDHYLLDFHEAENVKRAIHSNETVEIEDILGFVQSYPKQEVLHAIDGAVEHLAKSIASEILRLNRNESPKAVMLVGGGSLTPMLTDKIAHHLSLPTQRVAIRTVEAISNLSTEEHIPSSSEFVTPIGIAIAAKKAPVHYMTVYVNDQVVRLFELKEMTVADAFLAANVKARSLYGKPGLALSIKVNDRIIRIPGEHGQPAEIIVNGLESSTKSTIRSGDRIELKEGIDGMDASAKISDLLDVDNEIQCTINGQKFSFPPAVLVNGEVKPVTTKLNDRDELTIQQSFTIQDVLTQANYATNSKPIAYSIRYQCETKRMESNSIQISKNGLPASLTDTVKNHDELIVKNASPIHTIEEALGEFQIDTKQKIHVQFQGERIELSKSTVSVFVNGKKVELDEPIPLHSTIEIKEEPFTPFLFQDVFRFSEWKLSAPRTSTSYEILRNGEPSSFHEEIFHNDELQIEFK